MSTEQADAIRRIVDTQGWQAVREHPIYGPIWAAALADQNRFESKMG